MNFVMISCLVTRWIAIDASESLRICTSKKIVTKRAKESWPEPEEEQCEHPLERERGKQHKSQ